MKQTLPALTRNFAVCGLMVALVVALGGRLDATAQTNAADELPTLPSMPRAQDCENMLQAHLRLAARLQSQRTDQSLKAADDADAVAARGRLLYDECLRQTFGGGGMGG